MYIIPFPSPLSHSLQSIISKIKRFIFCRTHHRRTSSHEDYKEKKKGTKVCAKETQNLWSYKTLLQELTLANTNRNFTWPIKINLHTMFNHHVIYNEEHTKKTKTLDICKKHLNYHLLLHRIESCLILLFFYYRKKKPVYITMDNQ